MPEVKDKERILTAVREKQFITYRGVPIRLSADFSKRNFACQKGLARNIKIHEKWGPTAKIALPSKAIIRIKSQIKRFPGKKKLKEFIFTKLLLYEMLKGLI